MGYTHYWRFHKPERKLGAMEVADKKYKKAILECQRIARTYNRRMKEEGRDWDRLSGFSAHVPVGKYGGLEINGKQEQAHEPFTMREHFRQALELGYTKNGFDFCKTARKPYDIVVTACLAVLKYRLGDLITVSSDGDAQDWDAGVLLARDILKRKIPNPIKPRILDYIEANDNETVIHIKE